MTPEEQLVELKRGIVDFHVEQELLERLRGGQPLKIKVGFDPTRPDLHLGHAVLMTKMRVFQDCGHDVIFVVGDFTAQIGDPTGRRAARPVPTREEILEGARTYAEQAFKILDKDRTQVVYNSQWLGEMRFDDIIRLAGKYTLARMMERDDFKKRWSENQSISLHELLYPLAQAYDSVHLQCDVELGGTDQIFNLLVGRDIMRAHGQIPQICMTTPILVGTDGDEVDGQIVGNKMSKSLDNYVGVAEPPLEQFGKLMSISDPLMWHYYELLSQRTTVEIDASRADCESGQTNPMQAKYAFAHEIVARFHSPSEADAARDAWQRQHSQREVPDDIPAVEVASENGNIWLPKALVDAGLLTSTSEGRRRIQQGGVQVDGDKITDINAQLTPGRYTVKAGKRAWAVIHVR